MKTLLSISLLIILGVLYFTRSDSGESQNSLEQETSDIATRPSKRPIKDSLAVVPAPKHLPPVSSEADTSSEVHDPLAQNEEGPILDEMQILALVEDLEKEDLGEATVRSLPQASRRIDDLKELELDPKARKELAALIEGIE